LADLYSVWGVASDRTLEVARLGVESGLVPLMEMESGAITHVRKIKKLVPVNEYLKAQKRFVHLFDNNRAQGELNRIQEFANENVRKYGLH
jgi:pyruvate ferredoxin oxidoreductase beta subunit